jgi:hypothetical protein
MKKEAAKSRKRELDDILSGYIDILNAEGPESAKELAYLKKYADDAEALRLMHGARAVKALFESYGDFPDLSSGKEKEPRVRKS